ncbi:MULTISPECIES: helix-turn-helix domain-containing protein [unclassified Oceanispirochaeta]|uniref:helix-turn-helix domain-containing protein n=1 Tax=unclassified Oceanispirochaeta TaxID=2635722 RepID=UPI000E09ACEE|nr:MULTISPECIES: helix-turn-helix domain-containing protein [unclassified Oceanispirochaeta]MBF9017576.1 helix-turn-helix domain-containing protein [Oceanispirochaeta sp. M2]NPD74148.1 helix-turn-helix domain-containing protein [Oceanispirochaeta sp. M1]RDG30067.1 helix-turn-helix domain-containing protein [Oceanispirochaeta sp. M1]
MNFQDPFESPRIETIDLVNITSYWESEEHIRPLWKLYWNSNAGASLAFQNETIELQPEYLYLISAMTAYRPKCRGEVEHLYVHFRLPAEFSKMPQGIWPIVPGHFEFSQLKNISLNGYKSFPGRLLFQELITYALRQLPESLYKQSHFNPLSNLFLWLEEHLDEDCSNPVLAALAGYSEDTLSRVFMRETGKTPQRYLRSLRVSRAANLLRQSDLSMEEIAEHCGYWDRSHFHKSFQSQVGISPTIYRSEVTKL